MPRSSERIPGRPGARIDTPGKYIEVHEILRLDLITTFPRPFPMAQVEGGICMDDRGIKWSVVV